MNTYLPNLGAFMQNLPQQKRCTLDRRGTTELKLLYHCHSRECGNPVINMSLDSRDASRPRMTKFLPRMAIFSPCLNRSNIIAKKGTNSLCFVIGNFIEWLEIGDYTRYRKVTEKKYFEIWMFVL
jgi:hypothetical protein